MFSEALRKVENYTLPVIFSRRRLDGQIGSGCASFIVVNREGWILTAAHVVQEMARAGQDKIEVQAFRQSTDAIQNDPRLNHKAKHKELGRIKRNPQWITNQAIAWGGMQTEIKTVRVNAFADIAVGRLEPFDPVWIKDYPIFKNPAEPMLPGTSLCRLGFPFHQIDATFDQATEKFELAPSSLPVPRFPNDGIHTRIALVVSPDGKQQAKFLETSTPGLKGQSGGPIFDRNGHVWAMQSRTQSLALGFAPEVIEGSKKIVEHQFMHVGWGTHVEEIAKVFQQYGIAFSLSS